MENPASWTNAELIVKEVLDEHQREFLKPMAERRIGLSVYRQVTDALRAAGLLITETPAKADAAIRHAPASGLTASQGTPASDPAANVDASAKRRTAASAWGDFVRRGLIRDWPQEQAEVAFMAFAAGVGFGTTVLTPARHHAEDPDG